jgi:C-terminal processing protease CtpA/Prc
MDRPWDEALPQFIPKVTAALNELEYVKTMALMGAWLQDTHSGVPVGSTVFRNWLAGEQPPVQVRFIEDKPVVTRLLENDPNGPALGDEILEVDGLPVDQRFARVARYGSFSTPWSRDRVLAVWIMAGASGTRASLKVRRDGRELTITTLPRDPKYRAAQQPARAGEVVRVLEGNIGYIDLDRLEAADVDGAFERLKNAAGVIFDMRGYPRYPADLRVLAKLGWNGPRESDLSRGQTPAIMSGYVAGYVFLGTGLPSPRSAPTYAGPTVVLIDERAQSEAEETSIWLKAANNSVFIGSRTTGANGGVMTVPMPGGVSMRFTANEVRLPDGGQLQRVGLKPDIEVHPTIAGIKTGRDEILERAVRYLFTGR